VPAGVTDWCARGRQSPGRTPRPPPRRAPRGKHGEPAQRTAIIDADILRNRRDITFALHEPRRGVDRLVETSGARTVDDTDEVQTLARDPQTSQRTTPCAGMRRWCPMGGGGSARPRRPGQPDHPSVRSRRIRIGMICSLTPAWPKLPA